MTNHFKAKHRTTGEEILFSLGDIRHSQSHNICLGEEPTGVNNLGYWLKDYELFYQHQGRYYAYEEEKQ